MDDDIWTNEERRVFPFFNGEASVFADPMAVNEALYVHLDGNPGLWDDQRWQGVPRPGDTNEDGTPAVVDESLAPLRLAASNKIAWAAQVAFPMVAYDPATGKGALKQDCLKAYDAFCEWLAGQKKSPAGSPTAPAALAASLLDCPGDSPMPTPSGSG